MQKIRDYKRNTRARREFSEYTLLIEVMVMPMYLLLAFYMIPLEFHFLEVHFNFRITTYLSKNIDVNIKVMIGG